MEANSKKHRFRKGRSATFSIDGFNITIGKKEQAGRWSVFACELHALRSNVCVRVRGRAVRRLATSLATHQISASAQVDTLVRAAEVDACLSKATTPWKQGCFRLKPCAADVTRNSSHCLDNRSVDELMCHCVCVCVFLPFLFFSFLFFLATVRTCEC